MRMKSVPTSIAAMLVAALGNGSAIAAPTQWSGNGHYYEYISTPTTFTDAATAAVAMTGPNGQRGYLATITSAEENSFVAALAGGLSGWGGGSDAEVEQTWRWLDGPEAGQIFWVGGANGSSPTYANWQTLEPNDFRGEDHLTLNFFQTRWSDTGAGTPNGYFVEFGGLAAVVPIPEPATWALMIGGFGLVGASSRRRQRILRTAA